MSNARVLDLCHRRDQLAALRMVIGLKIILIDFDFHRLIDFDCTLNPSFDLLDILSEILECRSACVPCMRMQIGTWRP